MLFAGAKCGAQWVILSGGIGWHRSASTTPGCGAVAAELVSIIRQQRAQAAYNKSGHSNQGPPGSKLQWIQGHGLNLAYYYLRCQYLKHYTPFPRLGSAKLIHDLR
jgi:hypothetical protein